MISPPPLKSGDKAGIVSVSGRTGKGMLDAAGRIFEEWGLKVVCGQGVYSSDNQFAGTDRERAAGIQSMLDDPEIRAIICSRGGYGTARIIDSIDFRSYISNPKWITGYSDITVLHSHINRNFGIETLHAPMAAEFSDRSEKRVSGETCRLLKDALFGKIEGYTIPAHPLCRSGTARGILTGGNLSVLISLMKSVSEPVTRGRILFLEDVGEYLYHIDRMMLALRRSGVLEGIAGLVVGGLTGMKDNSVPFGKSAEEIVAGNVEGYKYPVCFGFPAGHQPDNYPLVMGREVELDISEDRVKLTFKQ